MAVVFLLAGMAFRDVGLIQPNDSHVPALTSASDGIWFRPPPAA